MQGDGVFQAGSNGLNLTLTQSRGTYRNEFGFYRVDDAYGRIGNLLPGDPAYARAALAADRVVVGFASGSSVGSSTGLTFANGQYLGSYLIQNALLRQWRKSNPDNSPAHRPMAFFSFAAANADGIDHLHGTRNSDGSMMLGWEDITGGGDRDYDDTVITVHGILNPAQQRFSYQAQVSDADGDTLRYTLLQGPVGAKVDSRTGLLTSDKPLACRWTTARVAWPNRCSRSTSAPASRPPV